MTDHRLRWDDLTIGQELPSLRLDVSLAAVTLTPAYTKDPYPGHWDVDYIRGLGHPTVFMNTMSLLGMLDRLITDCCGPSTFITGHAITMRRPTYAGRQLVASGTVVDKRVSEDERRWGPSQLIDAEVRLTAAGDPVCDGRVTFSLL